MKKILILANNDTGLYKFRKELIEELLKKYIVYISLPNGDFIPDLIKLGCDFINTNIDRRGKNPILDIKLLIHYEKILKKIKPDIVLTYTIKPNVYGGMVCRLKKIPYISNITGLGTALEKSGFIQKLIIFLYKVALKKAKCVFFQNGENLKFFNDKFIYNQNIKLIPGSGVNINYYTTIDYPSDEKINFLFISRVMKEKGIEQYIDAAIYIKSKYPDTQFHILGFCEEEYEHKLKELHRKGIIVYHGMQKDVRIYHRISHCTVHPSYYPEGLSNVLLESCACARPIITTDRPGCREVVEDGVNGLICKPRDSGDLIKQIEKFIALPYEKKKQMGLAGRVKVEREFDRNKVVEAYMEEIEGV